MSENGTLTIKDGVSTLRFERQLRHPVARVWKAITDPAELSRWWPAAVEMDFRPGGQIQFTFPSDLPDTAPDGAKIEVPADPNDPNNRGRVLEIEPERVFAIDWNGETLRMELSPSSEGCLLVFTHSFAKPGAARFACGWHMCLGGLRALLDGVPFEPGTPMQDLYDLYAQSFADIEAAGARA